MGLDARIIHVVGEDADDCLVKTLKALKKQGGAATAESKTVYSSPNPVIITLTNPYMRFSFLPGKDPRKSIVLGAAALAGINNDDLLKPFDKSFLQGPCLRGFSGESKPYNVSLKDAGTRIGNADQLAYAVDYLKANCRPWSSQFIGLVDPKKMIYPDGVLYLSLNYSESVDSISMDVYVKNMDVCKHLVDYVIPVFTFIQQAAAALLGRKMGIFRIITGNAWFTEDEASQAALGKSLPRIGKAEFEYRESKAFDLRYLDMTIQHMMGFFRRIKGGDLSVENPFSGKEHLECFYDYGEAFRYGEAAERGISWNDKPQIIHPQLSYYYDF